MDTKETTGRFYFGLTYQLAKEDITKMEQVESQNLYLCLSVAALMKDKIERENAEIKKMQNEYKRI